MQQVLAEGLGGSQQLRDQRGLATPALGHRISIGVGEASAVGSRSVRANLACMSAASEASRWPGGRVRRIRQVPDPVLRAACESVTDFGDALQVMVADMFATMDAAGGVGLAANQLGVAQRVFVYDCPDAREESVIGEWRSTRSCTQTRILAHEQDHLEQDLRRCSSPQIRGAGSSWLPGPRLCRARRRRRRRPLRAARPGLGRHAARARAGVSGQRSRDARRRQGRSHSPTCSASVSWAAIPSRRQVH